MMMIRCVLVLGLFLVPQAVHGDARSTFFERVAELCGAVFSGYSSFPEDGPFSGQQLVAEVLECSREEVRIPFAVGSDRSRTWILSWQNGELHLAHDHRHADGSPDEITMYGGAASSSGTDTKQSFAADEYTRNLIPEAATNVWTLELGSDGSWISYSLERHQKPRFAAKLSKESGLADAE